MTFRLLVLLLLIGDVAWARDRPQGTLVVDVRLNERAAPGGTRLYVHRIGRVEDEVATGWPGEPFSVPEGSWKVRAIIPGGPLGPVEVSRSVRIAKDKRETMEIRAVHEFGFLRVDVKSGNVVLEETGATLYPGDRPNGEGVSLILGQAEPLPVGRYTLLVEWLSVGGVVQKTISGIEIKFEETTTRAVDLGPTGVLSVDVQGLLEGSDATVELYRSGGFEAIGTLPHFEAYRVPVGRYDLRIVQRWPLPRIWARKGVEISTDEEKLVIIPAR